MNISNNNPNQFNFVKSIKNNNNINTNNFNTIYPYDSFVPGNLVFDNYIKDNKSSSPDKFQTAKDFFKIVKRNNTINNNDKTNVFDGKSRSLIKMNDIVNLLFKFNFISFFLEVLNLLGKKK